MNPLAAWPPATVRAPLHGVLAHVKPCFDKKCFNTYHSELVQIPWVGWDLGQRQNVKSRNLIRKEVHAKCGHKS